MNYLDIAKKHFPEKSVVKAHNNGTTYEDLEWNTLDQTAIPTKSALDLAMLGESTSRVLTNIYSGTIASSSGTTLIPSYTATPTITQGTEIMRHVVTPTNTQTKYTITASCFIAASVKPKDVIVAVFRNNVCFYTFAKTIRTAVDLETCAISCIDMPNTTSSVTYSIRVGLNSAATWYVNYSTLKTFGNTTASAYMIYEQDVKE